MARRFTARQLIHSTPDDVFDFVADHRNVRPVFEGVSRWEPITTRAKGKGATYRVEVSALGVRLGDTLRLDVWDRPRAIGWESIGGIMAQTGRWRFTPRDGGAATDTELTIEYEPPAGALGNVLAGPIESLIRGRLVKALERMRDRIEAEAEVTG